MHSYPSDLAPSTAAGWRWTYRPKRTIRSRHWLPHMTRNSSVVARSTSRPCSAGHRFLHISYMPEVEHWIDGMTAGFSLPAIGHVAQPSRERTGKSSASNEHENFA
jgi:hypothetical protein